MKTLHDRFYDSSRRQYSFPTVGGPREQKLHGVTLIFPQLYGRRIQEELDKSQLECDTRERQLKQWHDHWQSQLTTLASLNSE